MEEVIDPTWERVVQIEFKLDDLLKALSKLYDTQKKIEEKIDRLLSVTRSEK